MNLKKKNNDIVLEEVWCENGAGSTLPLLKYPLLEQTGIVEHCFTTRIGGVSKGIYESLNLSFTRGDEDAAVRENFRRLAGAMETDVSKFVFTDQTHTTNVRRVTAEDAGKGIVKERDYTDIDGLITNEPGLVLSTFYADCVPLYFVDPVHRAIGMSHSGWKGTVGKMGAATITAMKREFGTEAKDLVCAIGRPSARTAMRSVRMSQMLLKRRSRGMQMRSCSIRKMASTSLISGGRTRSS